MKNTHIQIHDFRAFLQATAGTSICILHVARRIRRGKELSLKQERFSFLINFIFEKEVSHKYVDPNIE
jgi:hypothetical protein